MAEFNLESFTNAIRQNLYDNFPKESDFLKDRKHKDRPLHIRDIAFGYLPNIYSNENTIYFDIGDEYSEEYYPYYHILEDADVIRKRGKGTKTSKGSQDQITQLGKRDYGRISFNGKTYSREYRKNVRGERSKISKSTYNIVGSDGRVWKVNKDANYYKNIHYHYIERILDSALPWIAQSFNLKMRRTELTDLSSEFQEQSEQDMTSKIMNIIDSFMGD